MTRLLEPRTGNLIILIVIVVVLFLVVFGGLARGAVPDSDPAWCYAIRSPDRQHYCLALAKHDPSECALIQDPDLRAECRALSPGARRQ